jgi:hypothetical protein
LRKCLAYSAEDEGKEGFFAVAGWWLEWGNSGVCQWFLDGGLHDRIN